MGKDLPAIELEDSGAKGAPFDPFPGGGVAELTVTRVGAAQFRRHPELKDVLKG